MYCSLQTHHKGYHLMEAIVELTLCTIQCWKPWLTWPNSWYTLCFNKCHISSILAKNHFNDSFSNESHAIWSETRATHANPVSFNSNISLVCVFSSFECQVKINWICMCSSSLTSDGMGLIGKTVIEVVLGQNRGNVTFIKAESVSTIWPSKSRFSTLYCT